MTIAVSLTNVVFMVCAEAAVEERARTARKSFVFIVIRFVCGLSVAEVCEKLMLFDLVLRRPETSATVKC